MPWITPNQANQSRQTLSRWEREGRIVRIDRGLYLPAEEADQDHVAEAAACLRHPQGVVCLISALRMHGLGTQVPQVVWLAVPRGSVNGRVSSTRRIRLLKWLPAHLVKDIETRRIAGVRVRLTTAPRTIIDCWRCPRLIGHETALEALRDGLAQGISRATLASLAKRYGLRAILAALEAQP
jgi:predicted transcriptional regulator of viral defense system